MRGTGPARRTSNRLDDKYKLSSILVMLKISNSGPDPKVKEIASKLRITRKELSLTMQAVADEAGLSVGFISQIERAITVPSLGSLVSIARVLGKPVSFFVEDTGAEAETTRNLERVPFQVAEGGLTYERVSAEFDGRKLSSVIVYEAPGHRSEPISHDGEEILFVLEGEITAEVDGKRTVLRVGDSIHFSSQRVHCIWNHSTATTKILWCGTLEIFDAPTPDPTHKRF